MKARYLILALGLIVSLSAVSCKKEKLKQEEARKVQITVKGAAEGTSLGVFFSTPLSLTNVAATVGADGVLKFDQDVKWNKKQEEYTTVTIYGAYDKSLTGLLSNNLSAKADQSTKEAFDASEILYAREEIAPLKPATIELSRLNKVMKASFSAPEGEVVQSVTFTQVCLADKITLLTGGVAASNTVGEIKPYLLSDKDGVKTYEAYVAESSAAATVVVVFQSGREVKFEAGDAVYEVPDFDIDSLTEPGIYDHKGGVIYKPGEFDQIAYGTSGTSRSFRVLSLDNGSEFSLTLGSKSLSEGSKVNSTVSMSGVTVAVSNSSLTVVKNESGKVVLDDAANNMYYMIPVE